MVLAAETMAAGLTNVYDRVRTFPETDQTEDFRKFDAPTPIIGGGTTTRSSPRVPARSSRPS